MPENKTFADRVWFAYHCLPRKDGRAPLARFLERDFGLPRSLFHKIYIGERQEPRGATMRKLAQALQVSEQWLRSGEGDGPILPPGMIVPPRPGSNWTRYGDIPGWNAAVELAKLLPQYCPPEAYDLAATKAVTHDVEQVTAELARAVAAFAWESTSERERAPYSTRAARAASLGQSGKARATALKMNDRKRR